MRGASELTHDPADLSNSVVKLPADWTRNQDGIIHTYQDGDWPLAQALLLADIVTRSPSRPRNKDEAQDGEAE